MCASKHQLGASKHSLNASKHSAYTSTHTLITSTYSSRTLWLVGRTASMAIPSALTNRPLASLKLPRAKVPQLIGYVRGIVMSMTKSSSVKNPTPSLKAVSAAIEALNDAQESSR